MPVIWAWFSGAKREDWLFWSIVLGLLFIIFVLAIREWRLKSALNTLISVADLDGSLLVLIPKLSSSADKEVAMQQLLREFLRDTTKVFGGQVSRALIVRPDPNDRTNYLVPWVGYQMPEQTLSPGHKFYIGDDPNKKTGIAGKVYKSREVVVVHFHERNWEPDDTDYIIFDYDRPYPPYRSFVGVPILGPSSECLGVLCFDSYQPNVFDSSEIHNLLVLLGRRIAAAMVIYTQLR
jgi:GAF domain-containing protein